MPAVSRRQFVFGRFPFFRRRHVTVAGIRFSILRRGRSRRRYLLIHGNEATAREVLAAHMRSRSGIAHLVTNSERYVAAGPVRFDPNRIFSPAGALRNVTGLNQERSQGDRLRLLGQLDRDREKLIRRLQPPKGGLLVALHNNSQGYSVNDEVPISDRASLADASNPHEFFLATDAADFEILARSPYNAVLQQKAPVEDDGSLSRQAAARGFRYVNLEVGLGKRERQEEMLGWLERHLP